jgi:hypothetical protein
MGTQHTGQHEAEQAPYTTAEHVTFTYGELGACRAGHTKAPRFGCPVCFLTLVYAQGSPPMVDVAYEALGKLALLPGPRGADARTTLGEFHAIPERINARHLVVEGEEVENE